MAEQCFEQRDAFLTHFIGKKRHSGSKSLLRHWHPASWAILLVQSGYQPPATLPFEWHQQCRQDATHNIHVRYVPLKSHCRCQRQGSLWLLPTFKCHFCGWLLLPGDLDTTCPWMPTGATALLMMLYLLLVISGAAVFRVWCCSSLLLAINLCFINCSKHRYSADNLGKTKGSIFASETQGNLVVSDVPSPLPIWFPAAVSWSSQCCSTVASLPKW